MIEVLSKPAEQIAAGDIQALIDSEVPEGEQIEFKETLSVKSGDLDRWIRVGDRVGRDAKNELLEEVVAFANAFGGALVLGVKESSTKPPVAAEITPVPRCAELAERLKLVFRDCVEPQIPRIEIFSVPTDGDSGVVVLRVGQSRMAPHRVTTTLKCPVRRADRSEVMTMREIQDMTLNTVRGLERLERRLAERSERFSQGFERLETRKEAAGIRLTATPVGDEIRLERVFRNHGIVDGLEEPWQTLKHRQGYNERSLTPPMTLPYNWRPMLRAARAELLPNIRVNLPRIVYKELHCDGSTEIGIIAGLLDFHNKLDLYVESNDVLVSFANLIAQADRIRNHVGFPIAEYAVEIEIIVRGRTATVTMDGFHSIGKLNPDSIAFPRYPLGEPEEFPRLLDMFYRDFLNHLGADISDEESSFKMPGWPTQD